MKTLLKISFAFIMVAVLWHYNAHKAFMTNFDQYVSGNRDLIKELSTTDSAGTSTGYQLQYVNSNDSVTTESLYVNGQSKNKDQFTSATYSNGIVSYQGKDNCLIRSGINNIYVVSSPHDMTKPVAAYKVSNGFKIINDATVSVKEWDYTTTQLIDLKYHDPVDMKKEIIKAVNDYRKYGNRYLGIADADRDGVNQHFNGGLSQLKFDINIDAACTDHADYCGMIPVFANHWQYFDIPNFKENYTLFDRIKAFSNMDDFKQTYESIYSFNNLKYGSYKSYRDLAVQVVRGWHRSTTGHREAMQVEKLTGIAVQMHGRTYTTSYKGKTAKKGQLTVVMLLR